MLVLSGLNGLNAHINSRGPSLSGWRVKCTL